VIANSGEVDDLAFRNGGCLKGLSKIWPQNKDAYHLNQAKDPDGL